MELHKTVGILRYSHRLEYGYRLVLEVDQAIADYYRALLPKWIGANRQRYGAHVSVVRHEVPANLNVWCLHEGEEIEIGYFGQVYFGRVYCWLNVFCTRLEEVRRELGLPVSSEYTRPPEGFLKCFHLTVANTKD